ncbi:hypothetical protein BJX65DRAFT_288806 [Aspergillus insuetus]
MQFSAKSTLLTLAAFASIAVAIDVSSPCDSSNEGAYWCAEDQATIAVCHLGTWHESAKCGVGCCAYHEINYLPFCYC